MLGDDGAQLGGVVRRVRRRQVVVVLTQRLQKQETVAMTTRARQNKAACQRKVTGANSRKMSLSLQVVVVGFFFFILCVCVLFLFLHCTLNIGKKNIRFLPTGQFSQEARAACFL